MYLPGLLPVYRLGREADSMTLNEKLEKIRGEVATMGGPSGKLLLLTNPQKPLDVIDDILVGLIEIAKRLDVIEESTRH
jgi:hypothetical protein